jgi:hypothetical protein
MMFLPYPKNIDHRIHPKKKRKGSAINKNNTIVSRFSLSIVCVMHKKINNVGRGVLSPTFAYIA